MVDIIISVFKYLSKWASYLADYWDWQLPLSVKFLTRFLNWLKAVKYSKLTSVEHLGMCL